MFIASADTPRIVPAVNAYPIITDTDFLPETADIVVIDHYALDTSYEGIWRGIARTIAVLDDLADRTHDCDILIDQTYGRDAADYKPLTPPHCRHLCGSDYAILRPQFSDLRKNALARRKDITRAERVFVSFGATNPARITQKILLALDQFTQWTLHIDIAMGGCAQTIDDVREIANAMTNHTADLHLDITDMAALMARADLAIGAGGTMSWERACLGLPTLLVELADNQHLIIENLDRIGAARALGTIETLDSGAILSAFGALHDDAATLYDMSVKAAALCDGNGAQRIVTEITGDKK